MIFMCHISILLLKIKYYDCFSFLVTSNNMIIDERDIIWFNRIRQGDGESLRYLFDCYYVFMCRYVNTLIEDEAVAEDIVQNIFIYIWECRQDIVITNSVRNYLFASCRHKSMNYLRDTQKFTRFVQEQHDSVFEEMDIDTDDLHRLIEEAVMSLPERCGKIFRMSYEKELSHKEIAEIEGISLKTVEAHMHAALIRLRRFLTTHLKNF